MKVLSLRYGENFAPPCGTMSAHKSLISTYGFVWYGKFGCPISKKVVTQVMNEKPTRVLFIKSGTSERYWAEIETITRQCPEERFIPEYYRNMASKIKCWIKIKRIYDAPRDVMSECIVASSGTPLTVASRVSMNPCLLVEYIETAKL